MEPAIKTTDTGVQSLLGLSLSISSYTGGETQPPACYMITKNEHHEE